MALLARLGSSCAAVRNQAVSLTNTLLQKDYRAEACACLDFVNHSIRYVQDIYDIETVTTPDFLLQIRAGDCDDKATLLASLLTSIGHRVRFIAVAFEPECFSHVWLQDLIYGRWVDLEPTEPYPCGQSIPTGDAVDFIYRDVCP